LGIGTADEIAVVIRLKGSGLLVLPMTGEGREPKAILTTEDPAFATDPSPIRVDPSGLSLNFQRPGAYLFRLFP
jgi:hypothetical protein